MNAPNSRKTSPKTSPETSAVTPPASPASSATSSATSSKTSWRRWLLALILANAALFPWLLLVPFGAIWLWQQGYLYWWLLAAVGLGFGGYLYARFLRRSLRAQVDRAAEQQRAEQALPDQGWAPRDRAAWDSVRAYAREADPAIVNDYRLMLEAAATTLEKVAAHYQEQSRYAVWNFTAPEALLLTERVSARLRRTLLDRVPGSHMIRIGQLVRLWDLKPVAQRGVSVWQGLNAAWRVARLVNPLGALLAEVRQLAMSSAMGDAGDYLRRRGVQIWIEEVGRAGIELYSGRLRVDEADLREHAARDRGGTGVVEPLPGPLRVTIAGQTNAGKSSLVNALLANVAAGVDVLPATAVATAYELRREGVPEALIIDTPGVESETAVDAIVARAGESDCLLWVTAAHRADRAIERTALDAIRARFAADTRRVMPPLLVVASHVDRLSPAREWQPPYDVDRPSSPKEQAIRGALEAIAADLDVPLTTIVPVRLDARDKLYNVDLLWAMLAERFDGASHARALRLNVSVPQRQWRRVLQQAARVGALAGRRLVGSSSEESADAAAGSSQAGSGASRPDSSPSQSSN